MSATIAATSPEEDASSRLVQCLWKFACDTVRKSTFLWDFVFLRLGGLPTSEFETWDRTLGSLELPPQSPMNLGSVIVGSINKNIPLQFFPDDNGEGNDFAQALDFSFSYILSAD